LPTAAYGFVLAMAAIGYSLLQAAIVAANGGGDSKLATAVGSDFKGKASLALYVASVPLAFVNSWISVAIYIFVALIWFVPDRRIETSVRK
jgi:uncharacterized membrane protein